MTISKVNKQDDDKDWILCSVEQQQMMISHFAISVLDTHFMVFMVVVPQMMVIFWVYALHTEHNSFNISKECIPYTFRVTELVSVTAELIRRKKYIGWIGDFRVFGQSLLQVVRQGWRVVPKQWKPEKGTVLGNRTTIGSKHSYPFSSPSLTLIGQTSSNHFS